MKPTHFYDFDKNLSKCVGFTKIRVTVWKSAIRYLYENMNTLRKLRNHSVEKREILSHWKKISSSIFYSKTNAFTKFLRQKCAREFLQFPHCGNFAATDFSQKFRQINVLLKIELYWKLIWRKKICVAVNFSFVHILWWILPFFRQINVFTKEEVTKELISRKCFSVIAFYRTFLCMYCVGGIEIWCCFSLGRKSIPDFDISH